MNFCNTASTLNKHYS